MITNLRNYLSRRGFNGNINDMCKAWLVELTGNPGSINDMLYNLVGIKGSLNEKYQKLLQGISGSTSSNINDLLKAVSLEPNPKLIADYKFIIPSSEIAILDDVSPFLGVTTVRAGSLNVTQTSDGTEVSFPENTAAFDFGVGMVVEENTLTSIKSSTWPTTDFILNGSFIYTDHISGTPRILDNGDGNLRLLWIVSTNKLTLYRNSIVISELDISTLEVDRTYSYSISVGSAQNLNFTFDEIPGVIVPGQEHLSTLPWATNTFLGDNSAGLRKLFHTNIKLNVVDTS